MNKKIHTIDFADDAQYVPKYTKVNKRSLDRYHGAENLKV